MRVVFQEDDVDADNPGAEVTWLQTLQCCLNFSHQVQLNVFGGWGQIHCLILKGRVIGWKMAFETWCFYTFILTSNHTLNTTRGNHYTLESFPYIMFNVMILCVCVRAPGSREPSHFADRPTSPRGRAVVCGARVRPLHRTYQLQVRAAMIRSTHCLK